MKSKPQLATAGQSTWQDRRAELLQEACRQIDELTKGGIKRGRAIKRTAREFAGFDLGAGRRILLSAKTMEKIWYRWKAKPDPSIFRLGYSGAAQSVDPVLLRLIVEHCLQTGASLEEAIEAIRPKEAKLSIQAIYRAVPKRAVDALAQSRRQLAKGRSRLEKAFLRSDAHVRKRYLKQRADLHRRLLDEDARLQVRLLRQRERLQKRFLAADLVAVRRREKLQRKFLERQLQFRPQAKI